MIARLIGHPRAMGEAFTVSISEHMSWFEVAEAYKTVVPSLEVCNCDMAQFERVHGAIWQIRYDRMYNRVVDNAKVFDVTELRQNQLMGIRNGLSSQLRGYS